MSTKKHRVWLDATLVGEMSLDIIVGTDSLKFNATGFEHLFQSVIFFF